MISSHLRRPGPISYRRSSIRTRSKSSNALPRLPVPDLRKTLNGYLKSLEPFLLEDEARGGQPFHLSYAARARWAEKFETGVGRLCQERLLGMFKVASRGTSSQIKSQRWIKPLPITGWMIISG
jgi:Choline/Carnitine o-acyltransferase